MKLVLIGAPGAGKGTQARRLIRDFPVAYIATGDMLREEIAQDTPLGREIAQIIDKGNLVPDELITRIVKDRISWEDCHNGFILDGFPRTLVQAESLDQWGVIDKAVYISVPDEEILLRIAGRETCPKCGTTYHKVNHPPIKDGFCDACGTALVQRKDDTLEAGRARIATFHRRSEPLVSFYEQKGMLLVVNGQDGIESVNAQISRELRK